MSENEELDNINKALKNIIEYAEKNNVRIIK